MQFNSFVFILLFLPAAVFLYFLANKLNAAIGKFVLLFSSIFFYCYTDISVFLVLGVSIFFNYIFSRIVERLRKWRAFFLFVPVTINICLLLYFKYLNFAISNVNMLFNKEIPLRELILPIGISFFTFQQIAYIVSRYRGELKNNSLIDYLVYILYFPKILMGPLADPTDFINQINEAELKRINWDNILSGIKIFSLGLFKKVMIADVFAKAVGWGYANFDSATAMDLILVMLFYTFEIYFDFSGFSDMAVGSSLMFNITLPINFDSPYKALSIKEFWKRWHISLTKFFTKYLYIPLGGNKKGLIFTCLNTMLIFMISGIWHGAAWTYILWGALSGAFCVFDRLFEKKMDGIFKPARWLGTFIITNVLMLLFRSDSINQWLEILEKIVFLQNLNVSDDLISCFNLQESGFLSDFLRLEWLIENIRGFWMNIYIIAAAAVCFLFDNNYRSLKNKSFVMMLISAIAFIWGFICLGNESVFVYFNF